MEVRISKQKFDGVYTVKCDPYTDERGYLCRTYDLPAFKEHGIDAVWVQQSISHTLSSQTVRGLHTQRPPMQERKLISIVSGKMFWVVTDLRKDSRTFGQWLGVTLSPDDVNGLFVEGGFAHGCLSLTDDCNLVLNTDNYYSAEHGIGIAWDDPDICIDWPFEGDDITGVDTHADYMSFDEFKKQYGGLELGR